MRLFIQTPRGARLYLPIGTESSYSHLCLDASSDGRQKSFHNPNTNGGACPSHLVSKLTDVFS